MRVLLLEDEPKLGRALLIALKELQLEVDWVTTLTEAHGRVEREGGSYALFILDRGLPDGEGLDLCVPIRTLGFNAPILVLTALGSIQDRVQGLNEGADDYLPKPFSSLELEARVRALLRRSARPAQAAGGLWQLDERQLRVFAPGRGWVRLTPLEFRLARLLIEREDQIISREMLLKEVWGFSLLPKTRTVDLFMTRLRKSFEPVPETPRHFLTVRGAGYRFVREPG